MSHKAKLGEILLQSGMISQSQLKSGLAYHNQWGIQLGESLVILGFISELDLLKVLSKQLHIPAVQLSKRKITPGTLKLMKPEFADKYTIMPLGKKRENNKDFLYVATTDPTNITLLDELRFVANCQIKFVVATRTSIKKAIRQYYYNEEVNYEEGIDLRIEKLKTMNDNELEVYSTDQPEPEMDISLEPPPELPIEIPEIPLPLEVPSIPDSAKLHCEDAQILYNLLVKKGLISPQEFMEEKRKK